MIRHRLRAELAIAACGVATDAVAQFDPPDPKVYARAEDHARARLRGVPCTEADVGHGCYRFGDRLVRDAPCATYRDNVIHVLPAPQCFKMTRPQRFRGIWLDDFEGQAFIPAGSTPPAWPDRTLPLAERRAHEERFRAATIWLEVERDKLPDHWRRGPRRVAIDFIGRKTRYPGHYGHMGMAGHEIVVDHIRSIEACPGTQGC